MTKSQKTREPLFHIVKRSTIPTWKSLLIRGGALLAALLLCSVLSYLLLGASPIKFLSTLWNGSFGSSRRIWKFAKDTAIMLCIALAVTPAFRMKFWNIGAEGQVLIGALAACACARYLGGTLPELVLVPLMFVAAIAISAFWAWLPAVFKAKWNTNETLFTLMMNYVAEFAVAFALMVWTGRDSMPRLNFGNLPRVLNDYLLLIIIVGLLTALLYVYLKHTKQGYEISVVGESENTARYIGINVGHVIKRTLLISGAICGLAGFLIVAALDHSVTVNSVGGQGFTAIMVSWLAKFNPLIMVGTSGLIVFLDQGATELANSFATSEQAFPNVAVGIILFFIIGCEFFINYQIKFRHEEKGSKKSASAKSEKGGDPA